MSTERAVPTRKVREDAIEHGGNPFVLQL